MEKHSTGRIALVELLIAFGFFALSAAVMLRLFTTGANLSRQSGMEALALREAQGWAERIYAADGAETALQASDWAAAEGGYRLELAPGLTLAARFTREETAAGVLSQAEITAWAEETRLFSLPVAAYKGRAAP